MAEDTAGLASAVELSQLPGSLASRREQLFPQLTDAEITRIGRFGTVRRCSSTW